MNKAIVFVALVFGAMSSSAFSQEMCIKGDAGGSRIVLAGPRGLAELCGQASDFAADVARFLSTRGEPERLGGLALSRALSQFAVH
jgi:hypothetical protein